MIDQICSKCGMENVYPDGELLICADCGYEKTIFEQHDIDIESAVKDAHGNILKDGDDVVLVKDLKVKGSSINLKVGTKIKNIRIVGGDHEIDCKTSGGQFMLKACFLKKC
ncbi:MAG: alkylphosphonate utilization protein [Proteobacteria bacterium]|nr:alkylphosphonate utilization protein [Pseudomonadota bacterium]